MKRIFRTVGILLLCGALLAPAADAQTRGRNNSGTSKTAPARTRPSVNNSAQTGNRPSNSGQTSSRPSNQPSNNTSRPGSQPPANNRPGNQPPANNRPGNQPPANNRPGNQPPANNRPGNQPSSPGGPIGSNRPNYQPVPNPPAHGHGPARPNMPPIPHSWYRPAPPPAWRPPTTWRPFSSILGVALGSSINMTINALINSGYRPSQYSSNTVYVNNVPMLNIMWPDAVLYYNSIGGLCGSRFIYVSRFQDMTRYNTVYASLVSIYGVPYSVQNTINGIEANWWGTGNQFITLSYGPEYNSVGILGYYTTLSFGI